MKRCFTVIVLILTLVLSLSACKKVETEYTLTDFESTVSFSGVEGQVKGNFVFSSGTKKMSFTLIEPQNIAGSVFTEENGEKILSYNNVTAEVREDSPLAGLFDAVSDFSSKTQLISSKGNKSFKGTVNGKDYELVFDCGNRAIKEVYIDSMIYIFNAY